MAEEKKGVFEKLKENITDKEEQLTFISVVVRLVVVVWSGFIVSLNYITLPGYSNEPKDITFPASLLTGALASFGLEGAKKRGEFNKVIKKDNLTSIGAGIMQRPQSFKIINTSSCPCCSSIGN